MNLLARAQSVLAPPLFAAVTDIAQRVRLSGGRAWLVGGSVRDLVLGEEVKDVDLEVFGLDGTCLQATLRERYPFEVCGVSFGVLKLKGFPIDISLPRRESKRGEGHRAFEIFSDPGLSVAEASRRRDFTVNAMYLDPLTGELEDPHHGRDDLEKRILRAVSPRFAEDPLRVLRGMQFAARFSLQATDETLALCARMDLEGLPAERLFEEWAKFLLKGRDLSGGLEFLRRSTWLRFFPELAALVGCAQDPVWHPEGDVWEHTKRCLDAFAATRLGDAREDLVVGLAVLCHDFGKPATTFFDAKKGRLRSLGHDEAGVAPTVSFLKRLTNDAELLKAVPLLVAAHMKPFALWRERASDAAIRRLALKVGRMDRLLRVARADVAGCGATRTTDAVDGEDIRWLEQAMARLEVARRAPSPILQGRDLIALGLTPSPRFGVLLRTAFEAQLDGAFSDLAGAVAFVRRRFCREIPADDFGIIAEKR